MKVVILSVSVSDEQREELKALSSQTGQSVSNLVRQGINLVMGVYGHGKRKDTASQECSLDKVAD